LSVQPPADAVAGLFDVRGHTVIVTGAASGLGLAIAEVFVDAGAVVTAVDIDVDGLDRVAKDLGARGEVRARVLDVADLAGVERLVAETAAETGRLDAVFPNAGISAGPGFAFMESGRLENVDLAHWQKVLDTNLTSVLVRMRACVGPMKARRYGRIVVTSSVGGVQAEPTVGYGYTATKAAVNNLVRHAAIELAPHGVLVNAIAPGPFRTNIAGGRIKQPEVAAVFAAKVPLGRIAEPDELKGLALFLGSRASSYVTGTVIPIDGGELAGHLFSEGPHK
jgi:NAD(P)-dependent dehydrogenase (short-subunit alcohol dehydrogenase family)